VRDGRDRECFQPEDIEFLQRVFDRIRGETTFVHGTLFEELLASSLIQIYQAGNSDEASLLELGRFRIAEFSRQPRPGSPHVEYPSNIDFLTVRPREPCAKRKVDRDRLERADRESRVVLDAERQARDAKTARLRELRLKVDLEPKP
jgi:hypothetical protein